ncbi:hypothetical protein K9L04_01410 [Patescibacteria group bacterium]|nr:hypothetical protein [Patescibacteria group bacterium]
MLRHKIDDFYGVDGVIRKNFYNRHKELNQIRKNLKKEGSFLNKKNIYSKQVSYYEFFERIYEAFLNLKNYYIENKKNKKFEKILINLEKNTKKGIDETVSSSANTRIFILVKLFWVTRFFIQYWILKIITKKNKKEKYEFKFYS